MSARYSIVIPTYRRGEALAECLAAVCALDYPLDNLEVIIVDNGGANHTGAAADPFADRLAIRYLVNATNQGYGFSVNRGIVESTGLNLLLLNDDARPQPDFLRECDRLLASDRRIGCVGARAIEHGYVESGDGIGRIAPSGEIVANFNRDCGEPIEVEHVYGFCYVFTREAVRRAGLNDRTLLARSYSSGNRIETDHCLTIRERGLKVMFNPRMVALHLAKPRPDMSERSPQWKRNAIRNTIYLYLKHYGPFGRGAAALRLTFLVDVGLLSTLRRPSVSNISYLANGLRARLGAYAHYLLYLGSRRFDSLEAFRRDLDSSEAERPFTGPVRVARSEERF
jgi:GT2 family glycosyltransferase